MRVAVGLILSLMLFANAQGAEDVITFRKQPATIGQRMVQTALVRTETVQTYEQSNQIISEEDRRVRNSQVRHITTVATKPPVVQVTYAKASIQKGRNRLFAKREGLPVEQKTYLVTRLADDKLQITDASHSVPPASELQIVESTMSWVGRPNELAEFLNGRTVTVGEKIDLPPAVASKVFGGATGMGQIEQATLTLDRIKDIGGERCGLFDASLVGIPTGDNAKRIAVDGKIAVQANTCRTALAEMRSDLDMLEERGPKGATFMVRNRGRIEMAIKAEFANSD